MTNLYRYVKQNGGAAQKAEDKNVSAAERFNFRRNLRVKVLKKSVTTSPDSPAVVSRSLELYIPSGLHT